MSEDQGDDTPPEGDPESRDGAESDTSPSDPSEGDPSKGGSEGGEGDVPDIEEDEQADVPEGLADIDPEEVEEEAGASSDDESDAQSEEDTAEGDSSAAAMEPDASGSPVQAGEMYVSVVQSVTNAQIRKHGGPDADELDRDHFEQYELSKHFNRTMDEMGVGSDLDPHEALLLATVLSVGDGLVSETDVLDKQIDSLMEKAINGGAA